jgi:quinol monooxygenase YgiN
VENHVSWVVELAVKAGARERFKELMDEMVSGTSGEPEALVYEWYISDDAGTVHLVETYGSSEAAVTHVSGFLEKWAQRFVDCADVSRFVVYGDPSPAARELLDGLGATYLRPWGGFSRF